MILTAGSFLLCGLWAFFVFARRGRKYLPYAAIVPIIFVLVGGIVSFISATVIGRSQSHKADNDSDLCNECASGFALGELIPFCRSQRTAAEHCVFSPPAVAAIYNAAYLRMSTWVPFLWVSAQTLGKSGVAKSRTILPQLTPLGIVIVIGSYSTVTFLL